MTEKDNPKRSRRSSGAITLRDVAKLAGVAPITASRVLNTPDQVSEEVRQHVLEAVQRSVALHRRPATWRAMQQAGFAHGKALHQGWVQRQAFRTKTPRPWLIAYIHHATGRGQQQGGGVRQRALTTVADFFGAFAHPHQGQPGKAHRTHALLACGAKLDPAGHARHMQAGARVHRL